MSEPYRQRPLMEEDDDGSVAEVGAHMTAVEAEMAAEYLREHGISAFVHGTGSHNSIMSATASTAHLMVRAADEARATSLLRRLERSPVADDAAADDGEDGEVRCPRCELAYCFHEKTLSYGVVRAAQGHPLVALLTLPFSLFARRRYRCHRCLYVWDDPSAGPARMTPLDPDDPRPVFRLRRDRAGAGVLAGLALFGVAVIAAYLARLPVLVIVPLLAIVALGYAMGRSSKVDACSAPGCRAPLEPGADRCPACRGVIAGTIRGAHEHYSEAAAVRRELFALREGRARKKARAAKKKTAGARGRPRAAPAG